MRKEKTLGYSNDSKMDVRDCSKLIEPHVVSCYVSVVSE